MLLSRENKEKRSDNMAMKLYLGHLVQVLEENGAYSLICDVFGNEMEVLTSVLQ